MSVCRLLKRIFIEITERGDEIKLVNRPDMKKVEMIYDKLPEML